MIPSPVLRHLSSREELLLKALLARKVQAYGGRLQLGEGSGRIDAVFPSEANARDFVCETAGQSSVESLGITQLGSEWVLRLRIS